MYLEYLKVLGNNSYKSYSAPFSVQQRFIKSQVFCYVLEIQRKMRHNPCPGGAYNIVGEKSIYRGNFNLVTASAKIDPCSITVTYKSREQGRDQGEGNREYNSRHCGIVTNLDLNSWIENSA